jgi:hypothetical protein
LALDKKLAVVLRGKESLDSGALLELADMCQQYQRRYATAVKLYGDAFKANPKLANDIGKQTTLYNAARAAVMAGTGKGMEAANLKEIEKARHRHQARAWLQGILNEYSKGLKGRDARAMLLVALQLPRWLKDPDIAGVRNANVLEKLPAQERQAWRKLWAKVSRLLKDAESAGNATSFEGKLTGKQPTRIHQYEMAVGKLYLIELESEEFDAYLKLQDRQGTLLGENDDISPDNRNSLLVFTPRQDGTYRIVATSFQEAGRGGYTLRIRDLKAGK